MSNLITVQLIKQFNELLEKRKRNLVLVENLDYII
jgi:hypothetical protein